LQVAFLHPSYLFIKHQKNSQPTSRAGFPQFIEEYPLEYEKTDSNNVGNNEEATSV